jgi:hypothetical protein
VRRWQTTGLAVMLASGVAAGPAGAVPTREAYRYFRSLSIDLQGRMPTPEEIAAFERPGFDIDAWVDQRTAGPAFAERLRRVYMDRLRLEVGRNFGFVSNPIILRRARVRDPSGNLVDVYFRRGQRRDRVETDGDFCLTAAETGLSISGNGQVTGTATNVPSAAWSARTVEVRPWWLYRDHRAATPSQPIVVDVNNRGTDFEPVAALRTQADGAYAGGERSGVPRRGADGGPGGHLPVGAYHRGGAAIPGRSADGAACGLGLCAGPRGRDGFVHRRQRRGDVRAVWLRRGA